MWPSEVKVPSTIRIQALYLGWRWGSGIVDGHGDGVGLCYGRSGTKEEDLIFITVQFKEVEYNHDLISSRQLDRALGSRVEVGLVEI